MSYICTAFRSFYNQEESDGGLICNGTFYRNGFLSVVIDILETARLTGTRLCIYIGVILKRVKSGSGESAFVG